MRLGREELLRLARLAGLAIEPDEEAAVGEAVARLVAFGETLPEVEVAGEPAAGPAEEAAPAPAAEADDLPDEPLPHEAVEAAAPATAEGLLRVPPLGAWRR